MWLVVLTVPLRYAVSQSATEQVASTPSAGGVLPRLGPPSLRQTRAQPHSYLNTVQKLARHQLNATQRHHCQRLQPAHTAELANQNGGEDVSASRATASPTRRSLGRAPAARHRWPRLLTHTAPHRRHTHALGPALEHSSLQTRWLVRMSPFFATGRPRPRSTTSERRARSRALAVGLTALLLNSTAPYGSL